MRLSNKKIEKFVEGYKEENLKSIFQDNIYSDPDFNYGDTKEELREWVRDNYDAEIQAYFNKNGKNGINGKNTKNGKPSKLSKPSKQQPQEAKKMTQILVNKERLVLGDGILFRDIILGLSPLAELFVVVGKDKIVIKNMDPANVCMGEVEIPSSAFIEYEINEEKKLLVNNEAISNFVKTIGKNDSLSIEFSEENLILTKTDGSLENREEIKLLDLEEHTDKNMPSLEHRTVFSIGSKQFKEVIRTHSKNSESLDFSYNKNKITFSSEGVKKIDSGINLDGVNILKNENVKSRFSLEYLKPLVNGLSKLSDEIKISLDNDYPLQLEIRTQFNISFIWVLAPRIGGD